MKYTVKSIYYTLQGEGGQAGRPAVFLRFAGCNLWSGREDDRASARCGFCDTDFVGTDGPGGGRFADAETLARAVRDAWPHPSPAGDRPYVVCTGGEPALQLDPPLVDALHSHGFQIGIETNGTRPLPPGIDWVCVSPKAGAGDELVVRSGDELKFIYPQPGGDPAAFEDLDFRHFFLQPLDPPSAPEGEEQEEGARGEAGPGFDAATEKNLRMAVRYCLDHPIWRLSIQLHKILGLP